MEKLKKLYENVEKELQEISEKGLDINNIDVTSKLVKILEGIEEIKEKKSESYGMKSYMNQGYGMNYDMNRYNEGGYRDSRYSENSYSDYGRRGVPGSGSGRYNGNDPRMRDHLNRIYEGAEMYEYGRDRYQHGGGDHQKYEGLEKLMYALCMFIESTMEFADTPQEKDIVRKHIHKLRAM